VAASLRSRRFQLQPIERNRNLSKLRLSVPVQRLRQAAVLAIGLGLMSGERSQAAVELGAAAVGPLRAAVEAVPQPTLPARSVALSVTPALASAAREIFSVEGWSEEAIGNIDDRVLALALGAGRCAATNGLAEDPRTLTIIDYSKPSTEPRLWVLDLETRSLLYEELVAHGQGSGDNLATRFSNNPDSHQTSLGLFVTETTYVGRNGYSLRLEGLEPGFNDRARERAIVMHGAPYVNNDISKSLGRLGRSHGCPAVRDGIARELIDRVKGGGLVFAYYPDSDWLENSKFLSSCS
jgi:hypothetical protein